MVVYEGKAELSKVVILFNRMVEEGLGEAAGFSSFECNVEKTSTDSWSPPGWMVKN